MPLNSRTIDDESSFAEVTADPRQIAALYFYLKLDWLVECARVVAFDFLARPYLYTTLERPAAELLGRLRVRYGNEEQVPSREQRGYIFTPTFGQSSSGPSNGPTDFSQLRDELLVAAAAFAERAFDNGVEMLRERVRTTHRPFREHLTGLQGSSLSWSTDVALSGVTRVLAYPILRTPSICAVFGISTPPSEHWPFAVDSNGDKLIEEISKRADGTSDSSSAVSRAVISNRQRAALRGAEALAVVLDFTEEGSTEEDLDLLITKCYTWGSALSR